MNIDLTNNVEIQIKDKNTNKIKETHCYHNKATRNMVRGILGFLKGDFTYARVVAPDETDARKFIPCFMGFGNGGFIEFDSDGIPIFDENWDGYVDYNSTKLVNEIPNSRSRIRKIDNTFIDSDTGKKINSTGDMDSIIFHCEISPDVLNAKDNDKPVCVSEIGLFPSSVDDNMLACVRTDDYTFTEERSEEIISPLNPYTYSRNIEGGVISIPKNSPTPSVKYIIYSLSGRINLDGNHPVYKSLTVPFHLDDNGNLISEVGTSWGATQSIPDVVIGQFDKNTGIGSVYYDSFKTAAQYTSTISTGNGKGNYNVTQASVTEEMVTVTIPSLILQQDDVMSIKWTVTVASIGPNSVTFENKDIRDETGRTIDNNVDDSEPQISKIIVIDNQ